MIQHLNLLLLHLAVVVYLGTRILLLFNLLLLHSVVVVCSVRRMIQHLNLLLLHLVVVCSEIRRMTPKIPRMSLLLSLLLLHSVVVVCSVVRRMLLPLSNSHLERNNMFLTNTILNQHFTHRTGMIHMQPTLDTIIMEPMLT